MFWRSRGAHEWKKPDPHAFFGGPEAGKKKTAEEEKAMQRGAELIQQAVRTGNERDAARDEAKEAGRVAFAEGVHQDFVTAGAAVERRECGEAHVLNVPRGPKHGLAREALRSSRPPGSSEVVPPAAADGAQQAGRYCRGKERLLVPPAAEDDPTRLFDKDQLALYNELKLHVDQFVHAKSGVPQQLKVVLAGPGAGKTTVMLALEKYARQQHQQHTVIMAAMASAANLYPGGLTVHAAISENDRGGRGQGLHLGQQKVEELARDLQLTKTWLLLFDEVSALSADLFVKADHRFRQMMNEPNKPFGGLR